MSPNISNKAVKGSTSSDHPVTTIDPVALQPLPLLESHLGDILFICDKDGTVFQSKDGAMVSVGKLKPNEIETIKSWVPALAPPPADYVASPTRSGSPPAAPTATAAAAAPPAPTIKKRGRPRKTTPPAPAPSKKRGRPKKTAEAKTDDPATTELVVAAKRPRGRPRKVVNTVPDAGSVPLPVKRTARKRKETDDGDKSALVQEDETPVFKWARLEKMEK